MKMMENRSSQISELLLKALDDLLEENFKRFKDKLLYTDFTGKDKIPRGHLENADRLATKNLLIKYYGEDAVVDVTINVFTQINLRDAAAKLIEGKKDLDLHNRTPEMSVKDYRAKYRKHIVKEYQLTADRNARPCEAVTLHSRYTKLIMVNEHRSKKEKEHEIMGTGQRHTKTMNKHASSVITLDSLFKPGKDGQAPQVIMLVGASGIGKTMTARKIMLDWANGKLYKDQFDYMYYINCREMNLLTQDRSVGDMILKSYPTKNAPVGQILANPEKLLFIMDGFDELRFSFDQPENDLCSDPLEKKPVGIILSSLLRRTVLPECYLLITTRPASLQKVGQCLKNSRYVEILGFSEEDRKKYFQKFFGNEKEASAAFNFVRENEILFTMCFVPIVCWIICTVLKQQMERGEELAQASQTVTGVYLYYLCSLVGPSGSGSTPQRQTHLSRLCSLAADGIWEQKIFFVAEDIEKHGLDQVDFLPLFLNESIIQRDIGNVSVYSFTHLSFQEFFAALSYILEEDEGPEKDPAISKRQVKSLLEYYGEPKKHLRLTLQFLFGLLNEERMKDIEEKLGCKTSSAIKSELLAWLTTYCQAANHKRDDLEVFYFLNEIGEEYFKEVLNHFTKVEIQDKTFTQMDRKVLLFCIRKCHHLKSLLLPFCEFNSEVPKETLVQRLQKSFYKEESKHSPIYPLCQALKDSNCKLEKLQLQWCELTEASWEDLATILSIHWSLIDLDLRRTFMKDCVLRQLCEWMKDPNCKLQRLGLRNCGLKTVGCEYLSSALSTSQTLTELDLRWVNLEDGGVCLLCEGVKDPKCKLMKLRLGSCGLKADGWKSLSSALSTSQTLTELDLGGNNLEDEGVRLLCEGLKDPNCKLQKLRLYHCGLKAVGCEYLSSALSTSQTLTEFVLEKNKLEDGAVHLLCEGLKHPNCKMQKLSLGHCGLKVADFGNLSSVLSTNPNLTELELCETQVEDSGLRLLCEGLKHPECKLKKIMLQRVSGSKEMQLEMDAVKERKPDLVMELVPAAAQSCSSPHSVSPPSLQETS